MTAEVEWALMKAKVVRLEEELAELKETIVSSQILKLNIIHQVFKYYQLNQN